MKLKIIPVGFLQANCYIVSDQNGIAAVIDPGDDAERILGYLQDNSLQCKKIMLTHGHYDHTGGVQEIRKKTGASLVMNSADRQVLTVDFDIDEPVSDGDIITVGDLNFKVIAVPGHSMGGVCYLICDTLFTGDTLFAGSIGRSDFPGSDTEMLMASLKRLKELPQDDLNVYPGHGPATTLKHERALNPYLR